MKFKLDENLFNQLNKINEELDPGINGSEILYEDEDFSKTPEEADRYRTDTEEVLGFELNGNQVEYLATNWPAFYHDAHKYSKMKDQILQFLQDENLLSKNELNQSEAEFNFDSTDIDDDIDYDDSDEPIANKLHPANSKGFTPIQVQSWDTSTSPNTDSADLNDAINDQVEIDDFDNEDEVLLNKILSKKD